jgi:hypothetical protein
MKLHERLDQDCFLKKMISAEKFSASAAWAVAGASAVAALLSAAALRMPAVERASLAWKQRLLRRP